MRLRFSLWLLSLFLLAPGCDGGDGAPCVIDSDCRDFAQVCLDGTCQAPGALPEAGAPSDGGPTRDAGGGMDAGGGEDDAGTPTDAGVTDAALDDGGALDGAVACSDATGAYTVSMIITGPCGTAAVGNAATVTAGATACAYTIASADMVGAPAADGTFVLDEADALVAAESSIDVGGAGAASCAGSLTGTTLTLSCGTCVMQLAQ